MHSQQLPGPTHAPPCTTFWKIWLKFLSCKSIWKQSQICLLRQLHIICKGLGFKSCVPGQPLLGCFPEIRVLGLSRMLSWALKSCRGLAHVRHLIHSIRAQWFIPVVVSFWLLRRSKQTERPSAPPFPLPSSHWIRSNGNKQKHKFLQWK
jgi:hypothetical protein